MRGREGESLSNLEIVVGIRLVDDDCTLEREVRGVGDFSQVVV